MSTQGIKDGHGGSRIEYLDSWRISPLLGLRGSNRFENKRGHKDRRPSQKETAIGKLRPSSGGGANQSQSPNRNLGSVEGTQVLVPLKIIGKTICTGAWTL